MLEIDRKCEITGLERVASYHRVPLLVFQRHLGEDGARGKVGAVGFDVEGLGWVRRDENRSGGVQPGESGSLSFFPVPVGVVSG